jgi:hypothetical protein
VNFGISSIGAKTKTLATTRNQAQSQGSKTAVEFKKQVQTGFSPRTSKKFVNFRPVFLRKSLEMVEQDHSELTQAEAELYDRQIRLWGLENQKR